VPREDGVSIVLDHVLDLVDVRVADGQDRLDVVDLLSADHLLGAGHATTSVGWVGKAGRMWLTMKRPADDGSPRSTNREGAKNAAVSRRRNASKRTSLPPGKTRYKVAREILASAAMSSTVTFPIPHRSQHRLVASRRRSSVDGRSTRPAGGALASTSAGATT